MNEGGVSTLRVVTRTGLVPGLGDSGSDVFVARLS